MKDFDSILACYTNLLMKVGEFEVLLGESFIEEVFEKADLREELWKGVRIFINQYRKDWEELIGEHKEFVKKLNG